MTIRAILQSKGNDVLSVSGSATVAEAVALLAEKRIGALPVIDGGKVRGIFSERDVLYGLAVLTALSLMTRRRIRHLPVTEADSAIGFVSIGDLVKYRIDKIEAEAAAMREYIQSA